MILILLMTSNSMKTHFMLQLTAGTVHQRELAINQLFILFCVVEVFMNNSVLAG